MTPQDGATLVYVADALNADPGPGAVTLALSGSGVPGAVRLGVAGISREEWQRLRELGDFPLGVEIWLGASDGQLAVLPRSTRWLLEA